MSCHQDWTAVLFSTCNDPFTYVYFISGLSCMLRSVAAKGAFSCCTVVTRLGWLGVGLHCQPRLHMGYLMDPRDFDYQTCLDFEYKLNHCYCSIRLPFNFTNYAFWCFLHIAFCRSLCIIVPFAWQSLGQVFPMTSILYTCTECLFVLYCVYATPFHTDLLPFCQCSLQVDQRLFFESAMRNLGRAKTWGETWGQSVHSCSGKIWCDHVWEQVRRAIKPTHGFTLAMSLPRANFIQSSCHFEEPEVSIRFLNFFDSSQVNILSCT